MQKTHDIQDIEKLKGVLCSLRQIEPNIFPEIFNFVKCYEDELQDFSRKRFYREQRKRFLRRITV